MLVREALQAGLPIRSHVIRAGFDREEKIRSPAISSDPRTVESNADSWSSPLARRPLEDLNDIDEGFAGLRLTDGMWAIVFFYVELDVGWSARIRRPCIILRENGRREKQKQGHNFHVAPHVCRRCLAGAKESLGNEMCAGVLRLHTSLKRKAKGLMEPRLEEMENSGAEEGGSGNGEDPGEDDATGNPQRTAERRREAPTPTIAPVMVCVVLTGMPKCAVPTRVRAPAASAEKPPKGLSLVMRWPMVLIMRQPPAMVPPPMARWQQMMTQ